MEAWSGKHLESFFVSLLYLFGTKNALIYDDGVRLEFADIIRTTFSIYRTVNVKTTYRHEELVKIKEKFKSWKNKLKACSPFQLTQSPMFEPSLISLS